MQIFKSEVIAFGVAKIIVLCALATAFIIPFNFLGIPLFITAILILSFVCYRCLKQMKFAKNIDGEIVEGEENCWWAKKK